MLSKEEFKRLLISKALDRAQQVVKDISKGNGQLEAGLFLAD